MNTAPRQLRKLALFAAALWMTSQPLFAEDVGTTYQECCYSPCECASPEFAGSIHVDYLYWNPCPQGFHVAFFEPVINDDTTIYNDFFQGKEKVKMLSHDFESGYRIGIDYAPCGQCWEMAFNWTYYEPTSTTHTYAKDDFHLNAFTGLPLDTVLNFYSTNQVFLTKSIADAVQAKWRLKMNLFDLELAQTWNVNSCMCVRPHIDLRVASLRQRYTVKAQGQITDGSEYYFDSVINFTTSEQFKHNFNGVGPRFGLDATWALGCGFGFYGKAATALLYGEREASDIGKGYSGDPIELSYDSHIMLKRRTEKHCLNASTDLAIGLSWARSFCNDCYAIAVKIGWEQHYFFNQGVADSVTATRTPPGLNTDTGGPAGGPIAELNDKDYHLSLKSSDLSIQGLTVSLGFAY